MNIWIDGDGCPKVIKEILFRAAIKRKINIIIVANHSLITPTTPFIKRIQVPLGLDKADQYLVDNVLVNDLVITADIPLAHELIDKNAQVLSPRGQLFTRANIKQILVQRNLNESLRDNRLISGGLNTLSAKDTQAFANHLDKIITAFLR